MPGGILSLVLPIYSPCDWRRSSCRASAAAAAAATATTAAARLASERHETQYAREARLRSLSPRSLSLSFLDIDSLLLSPRDCRARMDERWKLLPLQHQSA